MRTAVAGALAASAVLWAAGCGKRAGPDERPPAPAGAMQMTVEVKGMTKALNITWREWPNRVEEALSGLPGVWVPLRDDQAVLTDLIPLKYDPGKVTPEQILEVIRKQGFEAAIVPGSQGPAADKPAGGDGG